MMRHRALRVPGNSVIGSPSDCSAINMPEIECGGNCASLANRVQALEEDVSLINEDIYGLGQDIIGLDGRLQPIETLLEGKRNITLQHVDHEGNSKTVTLIGS